MAHTSTYHVYFKYSIFSANVFAHCIHLLEDDTTEITGVSISELRDDL